MMSPYKSLHDSYVSDRKGSGNCVTLLCALGSLVVLGILLAIAVVKRPADPNTPALIHDQDGGTFPEDQCSMSLVETIPQDLDYKANVSFGVPLENVWKDLIAMTTQHLDIVSFYWTLTSEDINLNSSIDRAGREILELLGQLPSRNVSVRLLTSVPSIRTNSTDLDVLEEQGAQVRRVNFGELTSGVLHSKFWIVDGKHVFIGSANMDWRALTQVKELGVVVYNCSSLAEDFRKVFLSYWTVGLDNSSVPQPWPPEYDTDFNREHPLVVKTENISSKIYLAASPPAFCPPTRTPDLDAILSIISNARFFLDVAVMDYFPTSGFIRPWRYWPLIDDAIRAAAFDRKVKIRLLVSCSRDSDRRMLPFLQSLAVLDRVKHGVSIQIRLFIIPAGNFSELPHVRINHNKFMVTEKEAYVGTSNWSGDYFMVTAGVGLVVSQHAPHQIWKTKAIQQQLAAVFQRDWSSEFAVDLGDLGSCRDCALCSPGSM
ncbi:5'-3' exonuclease PLD4 [Synchiropus splendidus]|uniref:5'-3' exonuclease PLD4 n=1 Tax=Synchiropus splendidus TaxID=270530 RepID=UPI00237DF05D|nr:5'-3' exonuclease PLD4 [Synchiropus splendidus]